MFTKRKKKMVFVIYQYLTYYDTQLLSKRLIMVCVWSLFCPIVKKFKNDEAFPENKFLMTILAQLYCIVQINKLKKVKYLK